MMEVTQGTLIYGLRSAKYPGIVTYGIIISAACDLAQDKINKVFYLSAVPFTDWLYSTEGFKVVTTASVNNCTGRIKKILESHNLSWDAIQTFSQDDLEKVLVDAKIPKDDQKTVLTQFEKYSRIKTEQLTLDGMKGVYKSERKNVESFLGTLFAGGNTHYVFIPKHALSELLSVGQGLVVDLLELDYFSVELIKKIAEGKIDYGVLSDPDVSAYDGKFVLSETKGFAYPMGRVTHPWCEYILQHFSNCFIRIGVDNPEKSDVKCIVDDLIKEEAS